MITVNIYYSGSNGSARSFAEEMEKSGIADQIRAEEGNIRYEYFYPKNDPETVLLIDEWENQEAIDIHHASPMMNAITELREKYKLRMKVQRYVSDDLPESDKKFIVSEEKADSETQKENEALDKTVNLNSFHKKRIVTGILMVIAVFCCLIGGLDYQNNQIFLGIGLILLIVAIMFSFMSGAEFCPYCGEMIGRRNIGGTHCQNCGKKIF